MSVKSLRSVPIVAKDGSIGFHEQVFFDDTRWVIRYLVVDTGPDLGHRRVLVSPIAVEALDADAGCLRVRLSREQVRRSPDIDTDQPVSRRKELEFNRYFGYATYWRGSSMWGAAAVPSMLLAIPPGGEPGEEDEGGDPHLRSSREVIGYRVQARDGRAGRIEDLVFDLRDWSIYYLVVAPRLPFTGRRVLLDPRLVGRIDWGGRRVHVDRPAAVIRGAPPFASLADITPDLAALLDSHFGLGVRG